MVRGLTAKEIEELLEVTVEYSDTRDKDAFEIAGKQGLFDRDDSYRKEGEMLRDSVVRSVIDNSVNYELFRNKLNFHVIPGVYYMDGESVSSFLDIDAENSHLLTSRNNGTEDYVYDFIAVVPYPLAQMLVNVRLGGSGKKQTEYRELVEVERLQLASILTDMLDGTLADEFTQVYSGNQPKIKLVHKSTPATNTVPAPNTLADGYYVLGFDFGNCGTMYILYGSEGIALSEVSEENFTGKDGVNINIEGPDGESKGSIDITLDSLQFDEAPIVNLETTEKGKLVYVVEVRVTE